jgi:hypothetical protein
MPLAEILKVVVIILALFIIYRMIKNWNKHKPGDDEEEYLGEDEITDGNEFGTDAGSLDRIVDQNNSQGINCAVLTYIPPVIIYHFTSAEEADNFIISGGDKADEKYYSFRKDPDEPFTVYQEFI